VLVELVNNKELVRLSLNKLKAKIEAQKAGKAGREPGASPISSEGIMPQRKFTPVQVNRPAPSQAAQTTITETIEPIVEQTPAEPEKPPQTVTQPQRRRPAPAHLKLKEVITEVSKQGTQELFDQFTSQEAYDNSAKALGVAPRQLPKLTTSQTEALLKGGANVLSTPLPAGYMVIGKNDKEALMWCKAEIIKAQVMAFDYETTGDPDDDTTDPQDHEIVAVSLTWKIGFSVMLPIAFDNYGANWEWDEIRRLFLKPLLEDPDILLIAHNIKSEYQWSLTHGIDFFHKALKNKVVDTMLMVKLLALPENTEYTAEEGWAVRVGLKPATKALLADENGMIHGLLHIDEIKSFTETVGKHTWEDHIWDESMGYYKSGAKKGQKKAKIIRHSRSRTFNELPVDKKTTDYSCSDSDWALGIFSHLHPMAIATGVMDVMFDIDVPRMMVLAEYELTGWHVSRDRLWVLEGLAKKALKGDPEAEDEAGQRGLEALLNDELIELVPFPTMVIDDNGVETIEVPAGEYEMGRWRGADVFLTIKTSKPFNWGSPQHKQWLFFHVLKFPTTYERSKDTGLPSTNAKVMDKLIEGYDGESPFMKILKEKSKYDKIFSTYVEGMLPFCRVDSDRLHSNLSLVSTWRLSSKKPNLQNIPRPENDPMGIRGVFIAPYLPPSGEIIIPEKRILLPDKSPSTSEGRIVTPDDMNPWTAKTWNFIIKHKLSGHTFYVGSDYAQIELKVLAWYAGEASMIWALANGVDIHSKTAKDVFKLDCTVEEVKEKYKPYRYRAKTVNFGLVYGMTEFGLSKDPKMGMTQQQAKKFIEDYMATYPGVREYANSMIAFGREHGYVETMFGHRRPVPHINDPNQFVKQKAENICMNTPIQGSAADIIALAMVNIRKEQHLAPYLSMHMQIHDELQGQAPVEHVVESAWFMQDVMERPIEGFSNIMPITSEPAVGATWDTALDLKRDEHGNPYVKPKKEKKEDSDVTYDMIEPYYKMYELAGIRIA
jgi:DNA polymerase I-like protein with 3'-5' exonuclease and polymerase domains